MAETDGIEEAKRRIAKVIETGDNHLDLMGLGLTSLEPIADDLARAKSLKSLFVSDNPFTDISPITGMGELTELSLGDTPIANLEPITGLTGIESLYLNGTQITDITPLMQMPGIHTLDLSNTRITDISPILEITGVRFLDLSNTGITDISLMSEMTEINTLELTGTQITDIAPLTGMTGLRRLNLSNTQITDIAPIAGMTGIRMLFLSNTQLTDIAPIAMMTGISGLALNGSRIDSISPIAGMTKIAALYLSGTQITDIAPIAGMTGITLLDIHGTRIADISPLMGMTRIKALDLRGTQISDIRPIRGLTQLVESPVPHWNGLQFKDTPACRLDPKIAEIAEVEDDADRARQLFDYLENWVPPGERTTSRSQPNQKFFFTSYARDDAAQVGPLKEHLSNNSGPFWWDQDIPAGTDWRETVADQLTKAAAVVTFWTKQSVQSKAVREEASKAQSTRRLIHVRLDDAELPFGFGETQYIDLRQWDGTDTHPEMRKLLQALNDRLEAPTLAQITARLNSASPVAFVARDKMLSPVDTPPNTQPVVSNPRDLAERLGGLRETLEGLCVKVDDRENYQFPEDLHHCLRNYKTAFLPEKPNWYRLSECRNELNDCIVAHFAAESWNTVTYKQVVRFQIGVAELQPLLQPRQIPADEPDAKPPVVEPVILEADVAQVDDIANQIQSEMQSVEAQQVLDTQSLALVENFADLIKQAAVEMDPNGARRFKRLRRGLKGLAFATGGVIAAVGGGIMVNVLTAPEAAVTLAQRLTPILERILAFFL